MVKQAIQDCRGHHGISKNAPPFTHRTVGGNQDRSLLVAARSARHGRRQRGDARWVAQARQVMETVRPKYSCRTCDKIIQAPAPVKAIARGKLARPYHDGERGYHLPFYRQAQMMAAKGVDIERTTLRAAPAMPPPCSIRSTTTSVRSAVPAPRSTPTTRASDPGAQQRQDTQGRALGLPRRRSQLGFAGAADRLVLRHHGPRRRERDD